MRDFGKKLLGPRSSILIFMVLGVRYLFHLNSVLFIDIIQSVLFAFAALLFLNNALFATTRRHMIRNRPWQLLFSILFLVAAVAAVSAFGIKGKPHGWSPVPAANLYLAAMAFVTLFSELIRLAGRISPALLLPASFITVIIVGTILLMAPRSTVSGISPVDAVFTATSATCVTGLIVLDTATDFTFTGQLVILLLIQVGGLGLMTFVAFFTLSFGQSLGLKDSASISRIMDTEFSSDMKHVIVSIIFWTLLIETIGATLLYNSLAGMKEDLGWSTGTTLWQSVFHSVSAFCNAGFSVNTDNLEAFSGSLNVPIIIGVLIVLGGLGFMVLTILGRTMVARIRTGKKKPLPTQVRFVLLITAILILLGCSLFLVMEWNNTLSGMSIPNKLANSFLQGVTPRTAGFNTVPTSDLIPMVKWFFVILMFIGASPGGTGGGVKTTSIGLLVISLRSLVQQRKQPEIWKRRIPIFDLQRAGAVILVGMVAFSLSALLLLATHDTADGYSEMDYIFEAMSAFGTVGLSTGVTPDLSTPGRWIVIFTMFLGRTAPATLAAATVRVRKARYSYPEDRITIG